LSPQWSLAKIARTRRDHRRRAGRPVQAAMEPGEDRQDEGSRILGPLTWEDAARCERPVYPLFQEPLFVLSSFDRCTLSCMRAIPGI
jgi:hypothetical protein